MARILIVTLNSNENQAVTNLLNHVEAGRHWTSRKSGDGRRLTHRQLPGSAIDHVHLGAQGNVVTATTLIDRLDNAGHPTHLIFYGCAGGLEEAQRGEAYFITRVRYAAIGSVGANACRHEAQGLKPKWLAPVHPQADRPVEPEHIPDVILGVMVNPADHDLKPAEALATESTVEVAPANAPPPRIPAGREGAGHFKKKSCGPTPKRLPSQHPNFARPPTSWSTWSRTAPPGRQGNSDSEISPLSGSSPISWRTSGRARQKVHPRTISQSPGRLNCCTVGLDLWHHSCVTCSS